MPGLILLAMLCLISFCVEATGQSNRQDASGQDQTAKGQPTPDLPPGQRTFRPKLPMQEALRIAEDYIGKQKIDISSYWLYRAQYILMGSENAADKDKVPGWHFWWVNETGARGHYVEIFVRMDGSASRLASM